MITVATACNGVKECLFGEDEGPLCSDNSISTIILTVTCLAFVSIYLGLKCSRIISLKMNRNQEELQLIGNRSIESMLQNYENNIKIVQICLKTIFLNPDKRYKLIFEGIEVIPHNYDDNTHGIIDVLNKDVVILSLSAPGAPKLLKPAELSVKEGSRSGLIIVSSIVNPIL